MFIKYNIHAILWALFIFLLNLRREEGLPTLQLLGFIYFDKFAHFVQFCIFSFLLIVGFFKQQKFPTLRFYAWRVALMVCISLALLFEIIQFIRLPKYFEWGDLLANLLGCGGGLLIFYLIYKFSEKN
jgi:glycopeptide antibiotics resistance protein